jgi:hypothetical protein
MFLIVITTNINFKIIVFIFSIFSILYKKGGILYERVRGCPSTFRYRKLSEQLTGLCEWIPPYQYVVSTFAIVMATICEWNKYELVIINNINFTNSAVNVTMFF